MAEPEKMPATPPKCNTCGASLTYDSLAPSWKTIPPDKVPAHAYHHWMCDETMLDAAIEALKKLNRSRHTEH